MRFQQGVVKRVIKGIKLCRTIPVLQLMWYYHNDPKYWDI